jgi:hypothetical protein
MSKASRSFRAPKAARLPKAVVTPLVQPRTPSEHDASESAARARRTVPASNGAPPMSGGSGH